MLRNWRTLLFFALIAVFAIWIQWWASLGFPLDHEICSEPKGSDDCGSYNVILYSAWAFGKTVDRWSALITAIATGAIGYFTLTLKRSTDRLWAESREQRTESSKAAERQFKIAEQSIKLAQDEFVSGHRPRIILREAIIGTVLEGEPISIFYHLANVGETTGRIIRSSVRVEVIPRSNQRLLLHASVENQYDLGEIVLSAGTATLLKFEGETPKWDNNRFQEKSYMTTSGNVLYRDATVHFLGQFIYVDQLGIWRRTAFRRELIPERQRFYRIEGEPDLDYSD
jgi:hypothetical protein